SLKIEKIDGAMFDLGMSSLQLEDSGRGFSFQKNQPLLMTFKSEPSPGDLTAKDIVNKWREKEIADLIYEYGEERYSRKIAKGIIKVRRERSIETTFELVEIVRKSVPAQYRSNKSLNCATRTFQALRIVVNDELTALKEGINKAWDFLREDGKLVVISFHSLEDRIVKKFFKDKAVLGEGAILTKKPIVAGAEEKKLNPRSQSAKLRAMKKLTCGEQIKS
ncbi:MAG: 16S rRNA (cytosine(1402)-N(4))-methyltransferase RsmH, partial [Patescibacteria group bacterium]